jgi:hypothetical protein
MDRLCHHHPDREAAGTCCYCDRPLCKECLSTNRQGKSYCQREDDCLAYQDDESPAGEPISPIVSYLTDEYSLDAQVKRLSVTLEELAELRELPEDVGGDQRIPGYCACKLAEEAAALAGLIGFRVDFMRKEFELSGDSQPLERAKDTRDFIDQQAAPTIHEFLGWAKPYSTLEVSELLESIEMESQKDES